MAVSLAGVGASRRFALNQNHEINVTPFVDVMLVLLVVMMVAAPMATRVLRLDIPPGFSYAPPANPPVVISISDDGQLTVSLGSDDSQAQERPSTLDGLPGVVARVMGGPHPARQELFVRAGTHVKYGQFVAVVNRLQEAGYYKLGILSEEPQA